MQKRNSAGNENGNVFQLKTNELSFKTRFQSIKTQINSQCQTSHSCGGAKLFQHSEPCLCTVERGEFCLAASFLHSQKKKLFLLFKILKILKNQINCSLLKRRYQGDIARCTSGPLNGLCTVQIPFRRINKQNMAFTWHLYKSEWEILITGRSTSRILRNRPTGCSTPWWERKVKVKDKRGWVGERMAF